MKPESATLHVPSQPSLERRRPEDPAELAHLPAMFMVLCQLTDDDLWLSDSYRLVCRKAMALDPIRVNDEHRPIIAVYGSPPNEERVCHLSSTARSAGCF